MRVAASSEPAAKRRRGPGRPFKKGESGNPKGRAVEKLPDDVKALLAEKAPEAFKTVCDLMHNADKDSVRLAAAQEVLNRHLGKPTQAVDLQHNEPLAAFLAVLTGQAH